MNSRSQLIMACKYKTCHRSIENIDHVKSSRKTSNQVSNHAHKTVRQTNRRMTVLLDPRPLMLNVLLSSTALSAFPSSLCSGLFQFCASLIRGMGSARSSKLPDGTIFRIRCPVLSEGNNALLFFSEFLSVVHNWRNRISSIFCF